MGEFYSSEDRKRVNQFDRYKNCKILTDLTTHDLLLETRDIQDIDLNVRDIYHTVQSNEERRLDLISYIYYGNPLLWWIIAQANDIYDPLTNPKSGDIVRIPSLTGLYDANGILL